MSGSSRQAVTLLYIAVIVTLSIALQLGLGDHLHRWAWG